MEELHSEKIQLLQSLGYAEDTGVDEMREDVAKIETLHMQLIQEEQKYRAKYDNTLKEYTGLKEQAAEFDTDELMCECLAIRPSKERSAVSRMQSAYGNKYQPLVMCDSRQSVSCVIDEEAKIQSMRGSQYQRTQEKQRFPKRKSKDKGQER